MAAAGRREACFEFYIRLPVSGHGNQREPESAKTLLHTTWNHFKESGLACLSSCQLSVLSSFVCGSTPKAEEMIAFPLTVGSEEILLLMLQLLIYAKHASVQQHDSIKSAAALGVFDPLRKSQLLDYSLEGSAVTRLF